MPRKSALVKGFGRRPLRRLGVRRGRRSKASQGGNRGEVETVWRARLWGFADRGRLASEASAIGDARCFQQKRRWSGFSMATMRGSEALASVAGGLRPRAGVALVFRAAGGGGDRRCAAGCGATVMSCRS